MDIVDMVADARAEMETLMTDTCVVSRNGAVVGTPVIDPVTGRFPLPEDVTVYEGPCSTRVPSTMARRPRVSAGDQVTTVKSVLMVPAAAPPLLVDDRVLFTASAFNGNLPGLLFTVVALMPGSHMASQKVAIEVVVN